MREAFGCGFYPGPDQQLRSNKTVYGNAVWQRLQQPNDLAISTATRSKQEQQQTPTRSRQGHHALGIDGKLLMELLGAIASERAVLTHVSWGFANGPNPLGVVIAKTDTAPRKFIEPKFDCLSRQTVDLEHCTMLF